MTTDAFLKELGLDREQLLQVQSLGGALDAFAKSLEGNPGRHLLESAFKAEEQDAIDVISRLLPNVSRQEIEQVLLNLKGGPEPQTSKTTISITISKAVRHRLPDR
jgi:hypothetical protein